LEIRVKVDFQKTKIPREGYSAEGAPFVPLHSQAVKTFSQADPVLTTQRVFQAPF
jgi:hypothetical protein